MRSAILATYVRHRAGRIISQYAAYVGFYDADCVLRYFTLLPAIVIKISLLRRGGEGLEPSYMPLRTVFV